MQLYVAESSTLVIFQTKRGRVQGATEEGVTLHQHWIISIVDEHLTFTIWKQI